MTHLARKTSMTNPSRGEVWWVDFDPKVGAEIKKRRPAVVVNVAGVGRLPLRIVVPITNWREDYNRKPWLVYLAPTARNGLRKESTADCFQVKSVALARFKSKIGYLTTTQLDEIAAAIAICVGFA